MSTVHCRDASVCEADGEPRDRGGEDDRAGVHGVWQSKTTRQVAQGQRTAAPHSTPLLRCREPAAHHRRNAAVRRWVIHMCYVKHPWHRARHVPLTGDLAERPGQRQKLEYTRRRDNYNGDYHHRGRVLRRWHVAHLGDHHLSDT